MIALKTPLCNRCTRIAQVMHAQRTVGRFWADEAAARSVRGFMLAESGLAAYMQRQ